jgi:protein-disulfide isomerase
VTQQFLNTIYNAAGVDATKANAFAQTPAAFKPLETANTLANQHGVNSTPTILVGKRGGSLTKVNAAPTDTNAYKSAIDGVLGQA